MVMVQSSSFPGNAGMLSPLASETGIAFTPVTGIAFTPVTGIEEAPALLESSLGPFSFWTELNTGHLASDLQRP